MLYKEENYSRADSFAEEFDKHAGTDMNMITNYEMLIRKDQDQDDNEDNWGRDNWLYLTCHIWHIIHL